MNCARLCLGHPLVQRSIYRDYPAALETSRLSTCNQQYRSSAIGHRSSLCPLAVHQQIQHLISSPLSQPERYLSGRHPAPNRRLFTTWLALCAGAKSCYSVFDLSLSLATILDYPQYPIPTVLLSDAFSPLDSSPRPSIGWTGRKGA